MIIAVDGPAGAGKGTIVRFLANHYSFKHLETGLLYRLVALKVWQKNIPLTDIISISQIANELNTDELTLSILRQEEIGNFASQIAIIPEVRTILTQFMRNFSLDISIPFKGAILDGRDIGTIVCPQADIKLFIIANLETRAYRRSLEMEEKNIKNRVDYLEEIQQRDQRDQNRPIAPLIAAKDAFIIDTSELSISQAYKEAQKIIDQHFNII